MAVHTDGDFDQKAVTEYVEMKEVYDLFAGLMKELVIAQPKNPVDFLIQTLKEPPPVKICVLGPPGAQRSQLCLMLAQEYEIDHIHVGKLLELDSGGEGAERMKQGELVDDAKVNALVNEELSKRKSWILNGYPRTRVQALAMQRSKNLPDKLLLLHLPEEQILRGYKAKTPDPELIQRRLQHYYRHIMSTCEMLSPVVTQIDASGELDEVLQTMRRTIGVRKYSNAPLRPLRVCIVGSVGSGKTTQAMMLAKTYGAVHVDLGALINDPSYKGYGGESIAAEFESDEALCEAVHKRLNQADCAARGWILDGFPKTENQALLLRKAKLVPSRVVHLLVDEDTALDWLSSRKVDPVTGIAYYSPPTDIAIRQRLVVAKADDPKVVKERYQRHVAEIQNVLCQFSMYCKTITGRSPQQQIHEQICDFIDRPPPHQKPEN